MKRLRAGRPVKKKVKNANKNKTGIHTICVHKASNSLTGFPNLHFFLCNHRAIIVLNSSEENKCEFFLFTMTFG